MQPTLTDQERIQVQNAFRGKMLRAALHHVEHIDSRSLTVLQRKGLMQKVVPIQRSIIIADLIKNPQHADRANVPPGPMLFQIVRGDRLQHDVQRISEILFDPSQELRHAAITHFDQIADGVDPALTPKSRAIIALHREDATGMDDKKWRAAAVSISDAVNEDILCNLAGLRQALATGFEEAAFDYGRKVFAPSVASLDSIDLKIWQPSAQRAEIERELEQIEITKSITAICNQFYSILGHLPLERELSLATPIKRWLLQFGTRLEQIWPQVWAWADSIPSPFARYHACLLFLELPQLIPDDGKQRLWTEVAQLTTVMPSKGAAVGWAGLLLRRSILARHYQLHFSCCLPHGDSERLAVFSWWLADRVEAVMSTSADLANKLTEELVQPLTHWSAVGARIIHSRVTPSDLWNVTLHIASPWSFALQCQLRGVLHVAVDQVMLAGVIHELRMRIQKSDPDAAQLPIDPLGTAIAWHVVAMIPSGRSKDGERVFGFDSPIHEVANEWKKLTPEAKTKELLEEFTNALTEISSRESLTENLRRLADHQTVADQLLTMSAFRAEVFRGSSIFEELWKLIINEEWRDKVFVAIDESLVEPFVELLTEVEVRMGDKWKVRVSHFLSQATEKCTDDERRAILFGMTVLNCIATNSDSAIRRLLSGPQRSRFAGDVDNWREQLMTAIAHVTPYVASRIRSTLGSLHIK